MKNLLLPFAACLLAPFAAAQAPAGPAPASQAPPSHAPASHAPASQAPALAPAYTPTSLTPEPDLPRTPEGRPDFQGVVWATNFFPVFGKNPMAASLVVPETEAKKIVDTMVAGILRVPDFAIDPEGGDLIGGTDGLPLVRGERRTRLIVQPASGEVPLTPEAKKIANRSSGDLKDDYEQRPSGERCLALTGAPPIYVTISYNRLRFVQTASHVVIHSENGDEVRIIPFAAEHRLSAPAGWYGDSIARWEGDTLVIETIRQPQGESVRGLFDKFLVNADSKVIERFTRLSQAELLYQFTVEDPAIYTAPWLGEYSFYKSETGMFPSPCHEHNYSLPNILLGQRMADLKRPRKN